MVSTTGLAATAAAIGDPARAGMLAALMDGRALTAGELAGVAGIAPQTASAHLARLAEAGLIQQEKQGRHRYHRLASAEVAALLEGLMALAARPRPATGPREHGLRTARTCYDHMAGRLAVALADALVARGHLLLDTEGAALTEGGLAFLNDLGVRPAPSRRRFCRPCLDWSERRLHLGGAVGAALRARCVELGWVRPVAGSRALAITPAGELGFRAAFGVAMA